VSIAYGALYASENLATGASGAGSANVDLTAGDDINFDTFGSFAGMTPVGTNPYTGYQVATTGNYEILFSVSPEGGSVGAPPGAKATSPASPSAPTVDYQVAIEGCPIAVTFDANGSNGAVFTAVSGPAPASDIVPVPVSGGFICALTAGTQVDLQVVSGTVTVETASLTVKLLDTNVATAFSPRSSAKPRARPTRQAAPAGTEPLGR